ncbi:MAG: gfo/Idh/MocA family oxidoreductase, partial [Fimbriimonadaceae bacterium]
QIYGEEGSLHVPDPNTFGGPVKLKKRDSEEWEEVPLTHAYEENSRGVAVLDMAHAVRNKGCHRANDWLAYHVLDAMHAFHEAAENHKHVKLQSEAQRPNPMPTEGLE